MYIGQLYLLKDKGYLKSFVFLKLPLYNFNPFKLLKITIWFILVKEEYALTLEDWLQCPNNIIQVKVDGSVI